MKFTITGTDGETFARRLLKLAWDASSVFGMGFLQDRGQQDEASVWNQTVKRLDYSGRQEEKGTIDADYVFGRMMKLNFNFSKDLIEAKDYPWQLDYQSFCRTYPDFKSLLIATATSLGVTVELQTDPSK